MMTKYTSSYKRIANTLILLIYVYPMDLSGFNEKISEETRLYLKGGSLVNSSPETLMTHKEISPIAETVAYKMEMPLLFGGILAFSTGIICIV